MKLSVSQIKTFCSSKSKRAGKYILWIKDDDMHEHQILDFELTDEFDKKMSDKYFPIFAEMKAMKDKFPNIV